MFVSACFFDAPASLEQKAEGELEKGEGNNGRSVAFGKDRKG